MPIPPDLSPQCSSVKNTQRAIEKGLAFLEKVPTLPSDYNNAVEVVKDPFDLRNLRYREEVYLEGQNKKIHLTPTDIKKFVKDMNKLSVKSDKHFVIGVGTGGTISMSLKEKTGVLEPDLNFDNILKRTDSRLTEEFEVIPLDAFSTDSSQLEIDDVGDLAIALCYIWQEMKPALRTRFVGFLVVHGTDTMAASGSHLAMMLGKNMPFNVVHTGGQKTINEKINDSQNNVKHSLYMLKMLRNNECAESITVMGGKALLTVGMVKVSDHHAQAMATNMHQEAVDFGALPDPDDYNLPDWLREDPHGKPFNPVIYRGPNRVLDFAAEMQEDPRSIVGRIIYGAPKAILLITYGANTFDFEAVELIGKESQKQSVPAFAVSPVNANPNFDRYGATTVMVKLGVTPLFMTKESAHAKIMAAFARLGDKNLPSVQAFMADNFVGEIPSKMNRRELVG